MTGMLRMRRSRGVVSGFLLLLLGLWGGLIAFIGPYFHYAYTPDPGTAWTYTTARMWLEILPGAAVFLGGVLLIIAAGRHIALFGAMCLPAAMMSKTPPRNTATPGKISSHIRAVV